MEETFSVPELRAHQMSLNEIDAATNAVVTKSQGLGAGDPFMYGVFATPLVYPILMVGDTVHSHTISELGKVVSSVAEGFGTTADLYEAAEKSNVDLSKAIQDQIQSMEKVSR